MKSLGRAGGISIYFRTDKLESPEIQPSTDVTAYWMYESGVQGVGDIKYVGIQVMQRE
jgi:hypothetical protein